MQKVEFSKNVFFWNLKLYNKLEINNKEWFLMKTKQLNLFKLVNMFMVVFCICAIFMNHVGVNVISADAATSSVNGNTFEYATLDNSLMLKKNGNTIGFLPTNKKFSIRNDNLLFHSNATIVLGKALAALATGGLAAAGAAAVAGLQEILGGAFATAVASIELPGGAAVAATLGGAGEAAAAAAAAEAAIAAGGASALFSAFIVPVLVAGGIGAGVM